jgi:hypothetical protein
VGHFDARWSDQLWRCSYDTLAEQWANRPAKDASDGLVMLRLIDFYKHRKNARDVLRNLPVNMWSEFVSVPICVWEAMEMDYNNADATATASINFPLDVVRARLLFDGPEK